MNQTPKNKYTPYVPNYKRMGIEPIRRESLNEDNFEQDDFPQDNQAQVQANVQKARQQNRQPAYQPSEVSQNYGQLYNEEFSDLPLDVEGDYYLFIDNSYCTCGPLESIEEQAKLLLQGLHPHYPKQKALIGQLTVMKRMTLKTGLTITD